MESYTIVGTEAFAGLMPIIEPNSWAIVEPLKIAGPMTIVGSYTRAIVASMAIMRSR